MNPPSPTADLLARICRQNLDVYRASPARLKEDVSQEAQVATDYRGRLAYELLQNADDAMLGSGSEADRIAFVITDEELWVANTGRPLSDDDVEGLCGLGASTKTDTEGVQRASIGHKGMGFKSVLEITRKPSVYSTTHSFELTEEHARHQVASLWGEEDRSPPRQVPVMRFPAPIDPAHPVWEALRSEGCHTAFRFPFRDDFDEAQRSQLAELLLDLPMSTVLFLKNLDRVTVEATMSARSGERSWTIPRWRLTNGGHPEVVPEYEGTGVYRVSIINDHLSEQTDFLVAHDGDVAIGEHRDGLSGPAWEGVERTEVSIGILDPRDSQPVMPEGWRHFHVFLPTEESCPYPLLVNGAFVSNLSRQHIGVTRDPRDYNAYLLRQAARIYRQHLLPILLDTGPEAVLESLDRGDVHEPEGLSAARLFHEALRTELAGVPLLPGVHGALRSLQETVFPPVQLGERGPDFRRALKREASWNGAIFPAPEVCIGRFSRVARDHGAAAVDVVEALEVLASLADPDRSRFRPHESGKFDVDPVLDLVVALWDRTAGDERQELESRARQLPLFPTHLEPDGSVFRATLDRRTAFYPPRAGSPRLPLEGLAFLCHELCWGRLQPRDRTEVLGETLAAWTKLFEIEEFQFEAVMRAAVLPALVLNPDEEGTRLQERLQNLEALAAICQLAGRRVKPKDPLRYERLGGDRGLFNLSRLPVPCRSPEGDTVWRPAYRVYFGKDWIGDRSVEAVAELLPPALSRQGQVPADSGELEEGGVPDDGDSPGGVEKGWVPPEISFLASPDRFVEKLGELSPLDETEEPDQEPDEGDPTEVGLEEDPDRTDEMDEKERWIAFLSWIGVNQCLRPVHFHDVEDQGTSWLKTAALNPPTGWAFRELPQEWEALRGDAKEGASKHPDAGEAQLYFYEVRRLEHAGQIAHVAAEDTSGRIGQALLAHLLHHWPFLEQYSIASMAVVTATAPGRRKPPRASQSEVVEIGHDLWVRELRRWPIFPTSRGPRPPNQTWLPSPELTRRFGRRGQVPGNYLPLLDPGGDVPSGHLRNLAARLGFRRDLNPSTFGADDARVVVRNLARLYRDREFSTEDLRKIRPIYREVFELLSGTKGDRERPPLATAPLLAQCDGSLEFRSAAEIVYAATPGAIERTGLSGAGVPTFVIQADPAATAPLRNLFGLWFLEEVLDRQLDPGEPALTGADLETFRKRLWELARFLLARLQVDRPAEVDGDRRRLRQFVDGVEPVLELGVQSYVDGAPVEVPEEPGYFVEREGGKGGGVLAFVQWSDDPLAPAPEQKQALAMAIAEALGVNMVETFLAFIDNDDAGRRRLLALAGGLEHLARVNLDRGAEDLPPEFDEPELEPTAVDPEERGSISSVPTPSGSSQAPAQRRVPLVSFDELNLGGTPLTVFGVTGDRAEGWDSAPGGERGDGDGEHEGSGGGDPGRRAAPGVVIPELDRLGMRVTMAYELHRLMREGRDTIAFDAAGESGCPDAVFDVSTPEMIRRAQEVDPVFRGVMDRLRELGVSEDYPGFDILTVRDGEPERLIELKSSAVNARVQTMTWNEWKSAGHSELRERFWLYLVGNLRADIPHQKPFLRAIRDPFGTLMSTEVEQEVVRRAVQLQVREFGEAEHLDLV